MRSNVCHCFQPVDLVNHGEQVGKFIEVEIVDVSPLIEVIFFFSFNIPVAN